MSLEQITLLFLVVVFVAAEASRMMRGSRGMLVKLDESAIYLIPAPIMSVMVRLEDGREVKASLNSCTACLGRLDVGDEVRVHSTREGWVVDLPWWRRLRCSGTTTAQKRPACADPR